MKEQMGNISKYMETLKKKVSKRNARKQRTLIEIKKIFKSLMDLSVSRTWMRKKNSELEDFHKSVETCGNKIQENYF